MFKRSIAVISIVLAASFVTAFAEETEGEMVEAEQKPTFVKPIVYSLSLMAVGLPGLDAAGAFEQGPSFNNFQDAFQRGPEWEGDSAFFNFGLHPLWGSETYLRAREANFGLPGSIAFSMGMSVTWEYLFESWYQHPSRQDLIFTTGIGWILGETRYRLKQRTDDKWNWALDPINTTLEHIQVKMLRGSEEELVTVYALDWKF